MGLTPSKDKEACRGRAGGLSFFRCVYPAEPPGLPALEEKQVAYDEYNTPKQAPALVARTPPALRTGRRNVRAITKGACSRDMAGPEPFHRPRCVAWVGMSIRVPAMRCTVSFPSTREPCGRRIGYVSLARLIAAQLRMEKAGLGPLGSYQRDETRKGTRRVPVIPCFRLLPPLPVRLRNGHAIHVDAVSEPASVLVYLDVVAAHLTLAHEPVRGESPVLQAVGAPYQHLESARS